MTRLRWLWCLLPTLGCSTPDRCAAIDAQVETLQRASLRELGEPSRSAVLLAQRQAITDLARRDCASESGPYTSCLLQATTLEQVSACSGGAR